MDQASEKGTVEGLEKAPAYPAGGGSQVSDLEHEFTPEEQRRIVRRVDRRLVTTLGVLYCVSLMDRTNLGAANIAGMSKELMLIGNRYVSGPLSFYLGVPTLSREGKDAVEPWQCLVVRRSL